MTTCLILVAGGKGVRAGTPLPKQYQMIAGKTILAHALDHAANCHQIDDIVPVIGPTHDAFFDGVKQTLSPSTLNKMRDRAYGGDTRQASTQNGLAALPSGTTHALVHDAARPFLKGRIVDDLINAVEAGVGAVPALLIPDSIKRVSGDMVTEDPDRSGLMRAQTPQCFLADDLERVFDKLGGDDFTDAASAGRKAGMEIRVVPGDPDLFKITHPDDFRSAEKILMRELNDVRVGQGFDVHAFEPGTSVTLCGVDIAHSQKLKGHSDADVGLHALTDAILGALAAGDIGDHFPPTDAQWAGAASHAFLQFAGDLVTKRGGAISHVDVTLICEKPKIGPHRKAMVSAIAQWLNIEETRVSVKATTTEKLGFTGRSEGIAVQAVATLRLP